MSEKRQEINKQAWIFDCINNNIVCKKYSKMLESNKNYSIISETGFIYYCRKNQSYYCDVRYCFVINYDDIGKAFNEFKSHLISCTESNINMCHEIIEKRENEIKYYKNKLLTLKSITSWTELK